MTYQDDNTQSENPEAGSAADVNKNDNQSEGINQVGFIHKIIHWFKKLEKRPWYIIASIMGTIIGALFTIITFVFDIFPESRTGRWKTGLENLFFAEPLEIEAQPRIFNQLDKIQITYPDLAGKNNTLEKLIVNKLISYLEKDNNGEFKTYEDLSYFLEGYKANNPDSSFYMNVAIHQESEKNLPGYLYISFLRSDSPSKKDTVSLDFVSFDLLTSREIKLEDIFLGASILKQLVEVGFSEIAKVEESFVDGFFHLSPNFVLKDEAIVFYYYHEKNGNWKPQKPLVLRIPYRSIKSQINFNSKLKFLRDINN